MFDNTMFQCINFSSKNKNKMYIQIVPYNIITQDAICRGINSNSGQPLRMFTLKNCAANVVYTRIIEV